MTRNELESITHELEKLTGSQRRALRRKFSHSAICFLKCSTFLGKVDEVRVGFTNHLGDRKPVHYLIKIGPRGAILKCRCLGR